MHCATCAQVLLCWQDRGEAMTCPSCGATMMKRSDLPRAWYFWRCQDLQRPVGKMIIACIECNPLLWEDGDPVISRTGTTRIMGVINLDLHGSNEQKRWRTRLYARLKEQRRERDNAEYAKRRQKEAEREAQVQAIASRRPGYGHCRHVSRRKVSDVGKTYKR
jgi:predicted RNA-binding Zn-ribbon protein involved in translation (DUF1610 family)